MAEKPQGDTSKPFTEFVQFSMFNSAFHWEFRKREVLFKIPILIVEHMHVTYVWKYTMRDLGVTLILLLKQ